LGPLTRISSLPPTGASLISVPGTDRPMTPARSMGKWICVAHGAVSVEPQAASMTTRRPVASIESCSSFSQRCWGRAAAA